MLLSIRAFRSNLAVCLCHLFNQSELTLVLISFNLVLKFAIKMWRNIAVIVLSLSSLSFGSPVISDVVLDREEVEILCFDSVIVDEGVTVGYHFESSANGCLEFCKGMAGCKYFSLMREVSTA